MGASQLIQPLLKLLGCQPVGRVSVRQPGIDHLLEIGIGAVAEMKQECGHFVLLRCGENADFFFDLLDAHAWIVEPF